MGPSQPERYARINLPQGPCLRFLGKRHLAPRLFSRVTAPTPGFSDARAVCRCAAVFLAHLGTLFLIVSILSALFDTSSESPAFSKSGPAGAVRRALAGFSPWVYPLLLGLFLALSLARWWLRPRRDRRAMVFITLLLHAAIPVLADPSCGWA
jgi:hypothetical protein